jgi:hypothetical protein
MHKTANKKRTVTHTPPLIKNESNLHTYVKVKQSHNAPMEAQGGEEI